jgi:hypothetical protein
MLHWYAIVRQEMDSSGRANNCSSSEFFENRWHEFIYVQTSTSKPIEYNCQSVGRRDVCISRSRQIRNILSWNKYFWRIYDLLAYQKLHMLNLNGVFIYAADVLRVFYVTAVILHCTKKLGLQIFWSLSMYHLTKSLGRSCYFCYLKQIR